MNYLDIIDNFHFLRPLWLLALLPLAVLVLSLRKQARSQSGWQGVLANHLYNNLISGEATKGVTPPWGLLFCGWMIACLALAGPTWERLPQPVYQVSKGKVVMLDMSMSMRAEDIKPNRLARTRYKAMDLVSLLEEGETGLVAYAGEAFVISPLTSDIQNLQALIPSLSPEIMPSQGSDALFALETTFELLKNAGYQSGEIYWLTDGVDLSEVAPIRNLLSDYDHTINILAIGTEEGAPIKDLNGNFLKDAAGAVVIPRLRKSALSTLAQSTGGRFVMSRPDDADIKYLTEALFEPQESKESEQQNSFGDQWREFGPWLLLILLPMAAYSFRRGVLPLLLLTLLTDAHKPVHADWWQDLWQTPNQQGAKSFQQEQFAEAAEQFNDPMWKGLSHFNGGNYEAAAEVYSALDTPDGNFALGNSLAQLQQYPQAIAAFERVLELAPEYPNAAENKKYLEDLMQQQEQQNQNSENTEQNEQQQDPQQQNQQDGQNGESQQQEQQQEQQSESQQSEDAEAQEPSEQQQSEPNQEAAEQQQTEQQQSEEQQQSQQEQSDSEQEMQEQQAQLQEQPELTDEQKEQLQKIENWLRKVPDDPAFLLKRKMLLEQKRRQRQRLPNSQQKNW
ncbi:vWA domain-containing protein [Planctobacterium marinum]|uniref:vWA domain-containing protein n=1 Tax=Planctobacterium marinum TaxID=1631968 RepID=UPI001E5F3001|nr:VWA domain-containing protein [Planctobacterium marinum]MCC2604527.1 VWA domain-containing protein [Planctobacterium marinum]